MKYYIHNLLKNTYFVVDSFDDMINWFARQNRGCYHGMGYWGKPIEIDPRKHHYKDYNPALNHIAMNTNDMEWPGYYLRPVDYTIPVERVQRQTMVIDEMDRVIDPRQYWSIIATRVVKYGSYKRKKHPYVFRFDPVPKTRKWRRGGGHSHIRTFQERKLSCDPEIQEYINPKRNMMNLPSSWDQHHRITNHCWKAKKLEKQWMKHLAK